MSKNYDAGPHAFAAAVVAAVLVVALAGGLIVRGWGGAFFVFINGGKW